MNFDKITCPYCFGKFEHNEVLFRAETVLSEDDFDIEENSFNNYTFEKFIEGQKIHLFDVLRF